MGRQSSAAINFQLTAYAQGHMADMGASMELAERIAPTVPVPGGTGQYKQFDDINSFQLYQTARALGGDANRIEFAATDPSYNCKPQALEVTVDQQERDNAGDSPLAQQLLDEGKIRGLLNATALSHVKKVTDAVFAALSAVSGAGNWSNPDIDPIDQLDEQVDLLTKAVGNAQFVKLTMDLTSWRTIRNHPKSKARVSGTQVTPLTRQQLVDALAIPVDLGIYAISYHTTKLGQASHTKARVMAGEVLLHYSVPNPTQYDPSAFKVFTMDRSKVSSVRTYQPPSGRYDVHAVDWSEDIKQTSTIAARRLTIT